MALGPLGWLYAGSWREAVPASAAWLVAAAIISKLGFLTFLLLPVLMVALPLSGLAGVMYALSYNRAGKRQRLFGDDKKKQLAAPKRTRALQAPDDDD
jgi:cytochrome b561